MQALNDQARENAGQNELRIVGFLCNWCSYGGADTAGVARATQPTDLRIIRVPCSGRVDPLFIIKALLNGADGVLVSGCHPRDCHYTSGNFYARRRLEIVKHFLPVLGIDPGRFEYTWVSASEGQRWQKVVTLFTEQIHALGPAPQFKDSELLLKVAESSLSPLRSLGTGKVDLDALKTAIKKKLPELDLVLGWQLGRDAAHAVPLFMRTEADVDKLITGPLAVHNLATYLPSFKGKKVGIVVKGCDSRSVVELLQEELIRREDVYIFALPCEGTLDMGRVDLELGRYQKIDAVKMTAEAVEVTCDGKVHVLDLATFSQNKCRLCTHPYGLISDERFGDEVKVTAKVEISPQLAMLDEMTLSERMSFWRTQMERCLRCYACRNACPLCVCRDHCISDSRDPHWISQSDQVEEKLFFQLIHTMHLAGRCTLCGECQRSCPVGIPILALREQVARAVRQVFSNYEAGLDPQATPPLLGYQVDEEHIREKEWK